MIRRIWEAFGGRGARFERAAPSPVVVMMNPCIDRVCRQIAPSTKQGLESIVYFLGLTTGDSTLAVDSIAPVSIATPTSVDVEAHELGKVIRIAADSDLQVVGQLHTHPDKAYHSQGDLRGMRIRHPGYFSIVVQEYGARLPSLENAHVLMWGDAGFRDVKRPVTLLEKVSS